LTFQAGGFSPLVTDFCKEMYAELKALFIVKKSIIKQYFHNVALKKSRERGVVFYSDTQQVNQYLQQTPDFIKDFQNFYNHTLKGKEKITRENCITFFHLVKECHKLYAIMNYEYTDKAFLQGKDNPTIAKNLERIAKYKDEMRTFINTVFFEDTGYIDTFCKIIAQQFAISYEDINAYTQAEIL
jgi:hypothetical protein